MCELAISNARIYRPSVDVVTLWNVLEHLHKPCDDLRRIHQLLRPGGFCILNPEPGKLEVRIFGDRWIGWDLPRHLYIFSRVV